MNIERRIERLQKAAQLRTEAMTTFTVEDGSEFRTPEEPLSFFRRHGSQTPDGRKIVGWQRPTGPMDQLSESLLDLVDQVIEGSVSWPEV